MMDATGGFGLALEALLTVGQGRHRRVEPFERNLFVCIEVQGRVDDTHRAAAETLEDPILGADDFSGLWHDTIETSGARGRATQTSMSLRAGAGVLSMRIHHARN